MARTELPAPADLVIDAAGNVLAGRSVTVKLAGTATNATHYSALTGGTSTTGGLVTHTDGTIVNGSGARRYFDSGLSLDVTIGGQTRQVETWAASGEKSKGPLNAKDAPYNAVGDGTTDDTAALTAALVAARAAGKRLYIPAGTYKVTGTLTGAETTPLDVFGDGMGRTTLLHQIPAAAMFSTLGSLGTNRALTNAPAAGTSVLQVASTTGWAAGDILIMRDSSVPIYGDTGRTAEAATGEMRRVKTVDSATQVTVRGKLENSYTLTNTLVAKLSPVETRIADLTISNPTPGTLPTTCRGLLTTYAKNVRVERVEFLDFDAAQIYLQSVAGFRVVDCRFQDARDLEQATNPYNIMATNGSCHGLVSGCRGWYGRHLFTTGAASTEPPAQHIRVSDCIATEYTQAAFDTHPGSRWITFADCEAHGNTLEGFQIRGPDSQVVNPTVSQGTYGVAIIYGADRCRVIGGRLSACGTGVLVESADNCYLGGGLLIDSPTTYGVRTIRDAAYASNMSRLTLDDIDVTGNPATAAYAFDIWDDQFVVRNWRAPDATTKVTGAVTTPNLNGQYGNGWAGDLTPTGFEASALSLGLAANTAHLSRYVPPVNRTLTKLAFAVTTASGLDDAFDVGVYSLNASANTLTRISSTGAVTSVSGVVSGGGLNTTGRKVITIPSVKVVGGTIYYLAISAAAVGATISAGGTNSTITNTIMGTTAPDIVVGSKATSHPLPTTIGGPAQALTGPKMAALE